MQSHASILSATCLPNNLSFAYYQQQLQQEQQQQQHAFLQPSRTIYSRQPSLQSPLAAPADAAALPQYWSNPMGTQQMYAPAYYQQFPIRSTAGYASSSASRYSESIVTSSASSTSSPAPSHSTLDDDQHASTPSSYAGHSQPCVIAGSDADVEQALRSTVLADPSLESDLEEQQESVFGKAPKHARRHTTSSSSSGSDGTHHASKAVSRNRSYSEQDSDSNSGSGHGHGGKTKRFVCPYAGCNKSFGRNFNLSTHYVSLSVPCQRLSLTPGSLSCRILIWASSPLRAPNVPNPLADGTTAPGTLPLYTLQQAPRPCIGIRRTTDTANQQPNDHVESTAIVHLAHTAEMLMDPDSTFYSPKAKHDSECSSWSCCWTDEIASRLSSRIITTLCMTVKVA